MDIRPSLLDELTLTSFAAFDFETTGLDPTEHEILEAGIVRFGGGAVANRYSRLFKPSEPVPRVITQITGIRQEDVENEDPVRDHMDDIAAMLEDTWLVAHNAPFDMGFLMNTCRPLGLGEGIDYRRVIDTLDLSALLLPELPNHKLITVAEHLGVPIEPDHRAATDAETAGLVFLELIKHAVTLDSETVRTILTVLAGSSDGLRPFFERVAAFIQDAGGHAARVRRRDPDNILVNPGAPPEYDDTLRVDQQRIDAYFEQNGLLAGELGGYEFRRPQLEMARAVNRALNERAFLLAEAGTGVGKSMAYLYPAALRAAAGGGRVVLSTHTKALQDQLFSKEIPLMMRLLDTPFAAVLLKGRNNYLCLDRWTQLLSGAGSSLPPSRRRRLLPIVLWAARTGTGDIEENSGFNRERNSDIWALIQSDGVHCRGGKCRFQKDCFYQRIRKYSKTAGVVLVNHALLFSDAAAGHSVLGEYDTLIVDEAHAVEKIASESLSLRLSHWLFMDFCGGLYQETQAGTGLLADLFAAVSGAREKDRMPALLDRLTRMSVEVRETSRRFFAAAGAVIGDPPAQRGFSARKRFRASRELFGGIEEELQSLRHLLEDMAADLSAFTALFSKHLDDGSEVFDIQSRELERVQETLQQLLLALAHFSKDDYSRDIVWGEHVRAVPETRVTLYSVPLDIAGKLNEMVYPGLERCVLTSATLSIADSFSYIMERLGLDRLDRDRVSTALFGSPFNYDEQTLLLAPGFLPTPKERGFEDAVADLLVSMLEVRPVGTMVLFTSHSMLQQVHGLLLPRLETLGIRLLGQGIDGPRSLLLKHFQEDRQSVLLGTSSFWEGVDVPGEALELLVITKIPFDVPTDPIVEARTEAVQARSGNGFINFSVPEAVVRFRQGFGRLIRSGSDRGAVLLADTRIIKSRYGRLFLDSLPLQADVADNPEHLLAVFSKWFN